MQEYTRQYEYIDGGRIGPSLFGKQVPVPPEWVRQRGDVPKRTQFACLSKEMEDYYPADVREVLVKYVVEWQVNRASGVDLIISGRGKVFKSQWAMAAVQNEITMRFGQITALTTEWLQMGRLRWLMDARARKAEEYGIIWKKVMNCKLLAIEDPMLLKADSEDRWMLQNIYQHRFDSQLPTITTLGVDLREDDWTTVRKSLGPNITTILRNNNHGYLAHF